MTETPVRVQVIQKTMSVNEFVGRFKQRAVSISTRHYEIGQYEVENA